jgi:hypothetical protein
MACIAEPSEASCQNPKNQYFPCCGATITINETGFKKLFSEVEVLLSAVWTLALNMVLPDKSYYIRKTAAALKCTLTSFLINVRYLLGAVYIILGLFAMDFYISDFLAVYYPVICTCKIEVDGYMQVLAIALTFGLKAQPCYDERDTTLRVDCDTKMPLLIYDIDSCEETIEWYNCNQQKLTSTTQADGTIINTLEKDSTEGAGFKSLSTTCMTDDTTAYEKEFCHWLEGIVCTEGEGTRYTSETEIL